MKISPIDIRQHTFEKGFRGYDIDEVDAFMNSLSQEWERVSNENKALKARLEAAENDLARMKDIEKTLYLTLKTAEETSKQITAQANQEAEQRLKESAAKSDALMNDAVQKANQLMSDAVQKANQLMSDAEQKAASIKETIVAELANQERDVQALEQHRTTLLDQLKTLVTTTSGIIENFDQKFSEELASAKLHTLQEALLNEPVTSVDPYAFEPVEEVQEAPVADEEIVEEEPIVVESEQEETLEVVIETQEELTDDELLEAMIAEEAAISEVHSDLPEEPVTIGEEVVEGDVADQALAEIERIRASRGEEKEPEPVKPVEEVVEKKITGSFFDQIG